MLKKIVCVAISFILATSFFISFTVQAAELDFLETHTVPVPTVPSEGKLLANDELNTEFNEEYYNDNHLVEDETEAGELFDEKSEFHTTVDAPSLTNSSKSTKDQLGSGTSNIANSTKNADIQSYVMRDNGRSDEYGIMTIADIDYNLSEYSMSDSFNWIANGKLTSYFSDLSDTDILNCVFVGYPVKCTLGKYGGNWSYTSYDDIISYNPDFFSIDNLSTFVFTDTSGITKFAFCFSDDDIYFNVDSRKGFEDVYNISCSGNYLILIPYYGIYNDGIKYSFDMSPPSNFKGSGHVDYLKFSEFYLKKSNLHDVYINGENPDKFNDDGFISGDIKGDFGFKDDSKILTYKAWSDKELDKTYDVHLWAMDSSSVPAKINGSEDFPIRDLDNYTIHGLQLSPDKSSVQASYELEAVYYYLHQMEGYDDSLESVDGYDFDKFESRENLNFAIAYREKGSAGDWIVCKSYQYNYGDLIENVMGSFTVRKDYVEFPDLNDYIEDFPSIEDFMPEDTGLFEWDDWVLAFIKWIGSCVYTLGKNFLGFFSWLGDCIPVLWENLTIALYNLVCDLKEIALYFVNPKTKSIYAMTCERIPSFNLLVDSFKNTSGADLPSFTLFGSKFSLNFSEYSIDFSFIRGMSTILFYILFGLFVFKLIFKIFGFGGSGGGDED